MSDPTDDLFLKAVLQFEFVTPSGTSGTSGTASGAAAAWYKDRKLVAGLVDAVAAQPLFSECTLAGPEDEQRPFSGVEAAKKLVASGKDDVTYLQDGPDETRQVMVRIAPFDGSLTLKIWCGGAALQRHRATLFDQLAAILAAVLSQLAGKAGLAHGYVFPVHDRMAGFDYPRPRPPRRHASIQIYSVVEYFDLAFHRSAHPDAALDGVTALLAAELPAFARRVQAEGSEIVEVRFADDAGDEAQLQRGASAHEIWLSAQLPTRIDGGHNELGDAVERMIGDEAAQPPLTLYSPQSGVGYKAVLVLPDGKLERTAWDAAVAVLAAGALPDGQPVGALKIIAPTRRHALRIAEQVKQAGFAAVLYPSDDGRIWNPDPPGQWVSPPRAE